MEVTVLQIPSVGAKTVVNRFDAEAELSDLLMPIRAESDQRDHFLKRSARPWYRITRPGVDQSVSLRARRTSFALCMIPFRPVSNRAKFVGESRCTARAFVSPQDVFGTVFVENIEIRANKCRAERTARVIRATWEVFG